jgi:hypothetical protein
MLRSPKLQCLLAGLTSRCKAVSVLRLTLSNVDSSDCVDPGDAAINELLGQIADRTRDPERRERIIGLLLTLPPIAEWPPEALDQWRATYDYIRSIRRDLEQRQLQEMFDYTGNDGSG